MIGNPVGFIEKLGEGVIEFVNEPRKGLIKGPKEFAGGIGKGVTSLVTGVVSAGFGSVSKITGSLYSIAKSATGEKEIDERRADNLFEGVYGGVTGAGGELFYGITGIFTKPVEGAYKEGVTGFFKGVGKGLLGGVASPFTAVLRLGNVLAEGVSNEAVALGKGKLP
jgi:vacuolar protein sorting-associated protein 13A/C